MIEMNLKLLAYPFLLCCFFNFSICLRAQTDLKKEEIFASVIDPYFRYVNDLIIIGDQYETSTQYTKFKELFETPDRIYVERDFDNQDFGGILEILPIGNYILELRKIWHNSRSKFEFEKVPRREYFYGYNPNKKEYIVVFKKTIIGRAIFSTDTLDNYVNSMYLAMKISLNMKITEIRKAIDENGKLPLDGDGDQILDLYQGYRYDDCEDKKGLLIFKGCPDSDEDGIKDSEDDCPYIHKGKGCNVNGCPDEDCDGVWNGRDDCPATPSEVTGVNKNGCERASKPDLIHLSLMYSPQIPYNEFADYQPLNASNSEWLTQVGFAEANWLPWRSFGIAVDLMPARWGGLGLQCSYWQIPLNVDLMNSQLNVFFSKRINSFENSVVSTSAYQGLSVIGKPFIGVLRARYALRLEALIGYNIPSRTNNSLTVRINLRNLNDEIQETQLMASNYLTLGGALSYSWTSRKNWGFTFRAGYSFGDYSNNPTSLNFVNNTVNITMDKLRFEAIQLQIGAHYSLVQQK